MKLSGWICTGLAVALVAGGPRFLAAAIIPDIRYSSPEVCVGDLHLPETCTAETPVVLVIHGGGWSAMDRKDVVGIAEFMTRDLGYAAFNVNYRLASKATPWPVCGEDCVAAAKFLLSDAFAAQHGLKPKTIWVIGGSAGGHLALWTALSLPSEQVAGVVSISGIADPRPDLAVNPARYRTLFGDVEPTERHLDSMDILKLVRPNGPKALLTHATGDRVVPIASAQNFARAYRAAGNDLSFYEYPCGIEPDLTGHCIWRPSSQPHRLIAALERQIAYFMRPAAVPEPQPVKASVDITALYYPGTEHMPEWNIIEQVAPERKPLLGWYDEHDPENVDWQIKWAVEHGIANFCVCWYWNRGVQRLDHWVKAFYQAKHRQYLKWYVMYANHNQPGAHSTADQIAVTKFWIENYFKTPEYYRIDGKPVVVYCTEWNLDRDFIAEAKAKGETLTRGEGTKRALALSERLAREAGLPGICWINMSWLRNPVEWNFTDEHVNAIRRGGFSAEMSYNLGGETPFYMAAHARGPKDRPCNVSYDLMAEAAKMLAAHADAVADLPFWPTVPTGYDDTVRAYQRAWVVRDFTAEKFRGICEHVKKVCDAKRLRHVVISPINEWQEGSYIEPNEEQGFSMYDAIRDTFCEKPAKGWPANMTPKELGIPLHEYPPMFFSEKQSWTFDRDTEGWYRQPFGTPKVEWEDGHVHFLAFRDDIFQMRLRTKPFDAKKYTRFRVRMRLTPNVDYKDDGTPRTMRLKWGTTEYPMVGNCNAVDFIYRIGKCPVVLDGQWHEYEIDLAKDWRWTGDVTELWFEAANAWFTEVDIDWMRFE